MRKLFGLILFLQLQLVVNAGTIVVSSANLLPFGNCPVYFASDPQRYTVSGSGLTQAILITAPDHFEISLNYQTNYSPVIQLNPVAGSINTTTLYVRFSPYLSGSKSGNILHSSPGCISQLKSLSGSASSTPASGTNASTYYSGISTSSNGATLKTALYNKILNHTVTAYGSGSSGLWATYPTTDPTFNNKVWDIYSTKLDMASPYEYTFSVDQCGTYAVEGDCYNREHSFPQSWFASNSPMVSDMFHIYPTDGKVNGMRNNYPHGEVSVPSFTSLQGGKLGPNTTSGYTGVVFEPINDYKGDLARSYFYMATRYENLIAGWQSNGNANDVLAGNAFPVYDSWFLDVLVKWHNQDPPGAKEINRNNAVYAYQNNRNPYIDSPQYVNRIWGGAAALEPNQASSNFLLMSNTLNSVLISWKSGNGQKRLVLARAGAPVNATPSDFLTYAANPIFGSGAQIGSGNYVVYNGMGSSIQVSGLNQNLIYHFLVIEYNGTGAASNYQVSAGLASGAISLPVSWLKVDAQWANANTVDLHWACATESNNRYFEIERGNREGNFEPVGRMEGKGNTLQISHYYFSDPVKHTDIPENNVIEYRIKQTDFDGKFSYSPIVSLSQLDKPAAPVSVYFDITANSLVLNTEQAGSEIKIFLSDLNGKIIQHHKTNLQHETHISLETQLPSGMYILSIVQWAGKQSFKIIQP